MESSRRTREWVDAADFAISRGRREKLSSLELSRWAELRDYEAGLVGPSRRVHLARAADWSPGTIKVADALELMLSLWDRWDGEEFTFARPFVQCYARVGHNEAKVALEQMEAAGAIVRSSAPRGIREPIKWHLGVGAAPDLGKPTSPTPMRCGWCDKPLTGRQRTSCCSKHRYAASDHRKALRAATAPLAPMLGPEVDPDHGTVVKDGNEPTDAVSGRDEPLKDSAPIASLPPGPKPGWPPSRGWEELSDRELAERAEAIIAAEQGLVR